MYGELPLIKTETGEEIPGFPVVIQNPPKTAVLRLPTSEEITAYVSTVRLLTRRLGRGRSESQNAENKESQRKLFQKIRIDKGEEFDPAEVDYALTRILAQETLSTEQDGNEFVVTVASIGGRLVHRLRMPTRAELQAYRDNLYKTRQLPHDVEEQRFPPDVPVQFYDAIILSVEGYAPVFNVPAASMNGNHNLCKAGTAEMRALLPNIPPHHKRNVAIEVSNEIFNLDPPLDPNL